MPNNVWKQLERDVCLYFGTTRTPGSGAIGSLNTRADSFHPRLFLEMKRRKEITVQRWYEYAFGPYGHNLKPPPIGLLIIRNTRQRGDIWVVHSHHLLSIATMPATEIKWSKRVEPKIADYNLFRETEEKAKLENKIPVVAMRQHRKVGFLMLLNPSDLKRISYEREQALSAGGG